MTRRLARKHHGTVLKARLAELIDDHSRIVLTSVLEHLLALLVGHVGVGAVKAVIVGPGPHARDHFGHEVLEALGVRIAAHGQDFLVRVMRNLRLAEAVAFATALTDLLADAPVVASFTSVREGSRLVLTAVGVAARCTTGGLTMA